MGDLEEVDFVVIGGGIAGVSCAETLCNLTSVCKVLLISASDVVKAATNVRQYGHALESMDVQELPASVVKKSHSNLYIIRDFVQSVQVNNQTVYTSSGRLIKYQKLCITTGAVAKTKFKSPHVLTIRDTESVKQFQQRLAGAQRVMIVGNGGIATEMVYEVQNCQVIWAIKHTSISASFFDAGAAQFFLPHLDQPHEGDPRVSKRWMYESSAGSTMNLERGSALGPDWASQVKLHGSGLQKESSSNVSVEYEVEMEAVLTYEDIKHIQEFSVEGKQWPVYVRLTNGKIYGVDIVVNATGVTPTLPLTVEGDQPVLAEDGGITVDGEMRSNLPNIYAAGDICSAGHWTHSALWHQMRLWTQAKQMGCYAAKCMFMHSNNEPVVMDFCFELFTHITQFFGFKVVLLGQFNAQGLKADEYTMHIRYTKGQEYVKVIVKDKRVVGAILIGETDLEETFENLILNQLDISHIEDHLLDPTIDIEDYFD